MKVPVTSSTKVYLNGQLLSDVVWADPDTGEVELFEHTCTTLHPPERIEETSPPPAPLQPSFDYSDCYICAMSGMTGCFCGQHVPYPA